MAMMAIDTHAPQQIISQISYFPLLAHTYIAMTPHFWMEKLQNCSFYIIRFRYILYILHMKNINNRLHDDL